MAHRSDRIALAAGIAAAWLAVGCGEGRQADRQARGDEPPSVQTDPVAERGFIRLTGCVRPDATPGRYVLSSVATAGVTGAEAEDAQARSWTAEDDTPAGARAAGAAASYQLIPGDDDDLARYENQRVTVRGRVAADRPEGTAGTTPGEAAREVDRDATGSKVAADAPPLPGFHVESVDKVADSCE